MSEISGDPIEELEDQFREEGERAMSILDEMRAKGRDVGKAFSRSGLPPEFQRRATDLLLVIEGLESDAHEYLVAVDR